MTKRDLLAKGRTFNIQQPSKLDSSTTWMAVFIQAVTADSVLCLHTAGTLVCYIL